MAKNTFKKKKKGKSGKIFKKADWGKVFSTEFFKTPQFKLSYGLFILVFSVFLFVALLSYLFTGKADQDIITAISGSSVVDSGLAVHNWLGLSGATIAHYMIFRWFGLGAFLVPPLFFFHGFKLLFDRSWVPFQKTMKLCLALAVFLTLFLGFFVRKFDFMNDHFSYLTGVFGSEVSMYLDSLMGWGTLFFLIGLLVIFFVYFYKFEPLISTRLSSKGADIKSSSNGSEAVDTHPGTQVSVGEKVKIGGESESSLQEEELAERNVAGDKQNERTSKVTEDQTADTNGELDFEVETTVHKMPKEPIAKSVEGNEADFTVVKNEAESTDKTQIENYDPTLELANYRYPSIDLLDDRDNSGVEVSKEELQANKDKIVQTLSDFNIGISKIKATIGPTVTLYELVPEAGNKISKIRGLEDDIALSLAALGIRMIAPIPGKGTIGIEVPNKNRETVSAKSVIQTEKFLKSNKDLPVVLGKTISNEIFVVDLAKMPHLLIAGATGQGKSVGLNLLLASLIYKKHPSQLKLVLVDPKKVELTLFRKLSKHFLAQLPDAEEPIITDTKKVVNTLNSLTIEMDKRYDLLKNAEVRNLKEYNAKFVQRQLNPLKGHEYLPYIVVVIDELADLMMTAGKEIEAPVARMAQLARAVGIHLVLATQRPSVNVITGIIKANFPARLSFRVTSSVDSKTILDQGGANQLIGQGDMLLSMNSMVLRLQCAFIDTPEVERICAFIGAQPGFMTPYYLPEYGEEDENGFGGITVEGFELGDRDEKYLDAAFLIVDSQSGSTSNIQRKLEIGYNKAGRIMDQLEKDMIVGPQEKPGKPRKVFIPDRIALEAHLLAL